MPSASVTPRPAKYINPVDTLVVVVVVVVVVAVVVCEVVFEVVVFEVVVVVCDVVVVSPSPEPQAVRTNKAVSINLVLNMGHLALLLEC